MTPGLEALPVCARSVSVERLADMHHLPDLLAACDALDVAEEDRTRLRLVVEEVCVNIIMHGYRDLPPGPIELQMVVQNLPGTPDGDAHVVIQVQDRARAFLPDEAPPPDLHAGWEERRIGGLGWHLVRHMVNELRHEPRDGGGNVLTLVLPLDAAATPIPPPPQEKSP